MGLFRRRKPVENANDLGVGVWLRPDGYSELVKVLHDAEKDRFYFAADGWVYGEKVGGYGRDELATLYLTHKLSLAPELVFAVSPRAVIEIAVIRNAYGDPVLAASDVEDGLDPLMADPAFHPKNG